MATSTTLITELGRRLRDPTNFAHSSAVLTRFLDHAQRFINYQHSLLLVTASFTPAKRVLYANTSVAANIARIEMIRQGGRNLVEVPWRSLVHNDPKWYRAVGQRYDLFARVGNDMFILYPIVQPVQSVDVVYTRNPAALTGLAGDVTIPDEFVPLLQDFVEALALLRGRHMEKAAARAKDIFPDLVNIGRESTEEQGHP